MIPQLRDLTLPVAGQPGRLKVRYSVITDRRGHRRVYFYFVDRAYEVLLVEGAIRDQVERLCLQDDARRSEMA
jgi:hypothetical protein